MERLKQKKVTALRRANRVRSHISGTAARPRLSVKVSNMHVSAQIIDDTTHKTLAYSTTVGHKVEGNLSIKSTWVGSDIAKKAKAAKVKHVVFDRGGRQYHGRVKALADAARAEGLDF
jgi:large subunit ribosomal protein L18